MFESAGPGSDTITAALMQPRQPQWKPLSYTYCTAERPAGARQRNAKHCDVAVVWVGDVRLWRCKHCHQFIKFDGSDYVDHPTATTTE